MMQQQQQRTHRGSILGEMRARRVSRSSTLHSEESDKSSASPQRSRSILRKNSLSAEGFLIGQSPPGKLRGSGKSSEQSSLLESSQILLRGGRLQTVKEELDMLLSATFSNSNGSNANNNNNNSHNTNSSRFTRRQSRGASNILRGVAVSQNATENTLSNVEKTLSYINEEMSRMQRVRTDYEQAFPESKPIHEGGSDDEDASSINESEKYSSCPPSECSSCKRKLLQSIAPKYFVRQSRNNLAGMHQYPESNMSRQPNKASLHQANALNSKNNASRQQINMQRTLHLQINSSRIENNSLLPNFRSAAALRVQQYQQQDTQVVPHEHRRRKRKYKEQQEALRRVQTEPRGVQQKFTLSYLAKCLDTNPRVAVSELQRSARDYHSHITRSFLHQVQHSENFNWSSQQVPEHLKHLPPPVQKSILARQQLRNRSAVSLPTARLHPSQASDTSKKIGENVQAGEAKSQRSEKSVQRTIRPASSTTNVVATRIPLNAVHVQSMTALPPDTERTHTDVVKVGNFLAGAHSSEKLIRPKTVAPAVQLQETQPAKLTPMQRNMIITNVKKRQERPRSHSNWMFNSVRSRFLLY